MRATTHAGRVRPRPLVVSAIVAATLGIGADQAAAAYTATVVNGTLSLRGNGASDTLVLHTRAGEPATLEGDVSGDGVTEFSFDRSTFTAVDVLAGGGDDVVRIAGGFTDELTSLDGGTGDDTLIGYIGDQVLTGGSGDDAVAGGDGNDVVRLGSGGDRFTWDPGDGSDTVEGQGGSDAVHFNGSNTGEAIELAADGARARLKRTIGNVTMDADEAEAFAVRARGGADTLTVGDLARTDVEVADVHLGEDGQADSAVVNGTGGDDAVRISRSGGQARVRGPAAETRVGGSGATLDLLRADTLAGDDEVTIASNVSDLIGLAVDLGTDDQRARPLLLVGGEERPRSINP